MNDARNGGAAAVDRLSSLLIESDRAEAPELESLAVGLLAEAEPALWTKLDVASRQTWLELPSWAKIARERIARAEPGTLALVVASFHPVGFVREAAVADSARSTKRSCCPRSR